MHLRITSSYRPRLLSVATVIALAVYVFAACGDVDSADLLIVNNTGQQVDVVVFDKRFSPDRSMPDFMPSYEDSNIGDIDPHAWCRPCDLDAGATTTELILPNSRSIYVVAARESTTERLLFLLESSGRSLERAGLRVEIVDQRWISVERCS